MSQNRIYPDGQEQGVPANSEHFLDCTCDSVRQGRRKRACGKMSKRASILVAGIRDRGRIGYADDNTGCALGKDLYWSRRSLTVRADMQALCVLINHVLMTGKGRLELLTIHKQ